MNSRSRQHPTRRSFLAAAAASAAAPLLPRRQATTAHEEPIDWLGSVRGRAIYSESAYLDLVSDDGRSGLIARIARYPTLRRGWIWGHAFRDGEVFSFTSVQSSCSEQSTDLERPSVAYSSTAGPGAAVTIEREGPRGVPDVTRASGAFRGTRNRSDGSARPSHGPGSVPFSFEAELTPGHPSAGSLAGRSEVLGSGNGELVLDGATHQLVGRGHFHEQTQQTARFVQPFVYASLRGPSFFSVAILSVAGAIGWAWIDGVGYRVDGLRVPPPGPTRRPVHLQLTEPGSARSTALEMALEERHIYRLPIDDVWRRGTLVAGTLVGSADHPERKLSGCLNDHLIDRLPYAEPTGP